MSLTDLDLVVDELANRHVFRRLAFTKEQFKDVVFWTLLNLPSDDFKGSRPYDTVIPEIVSANFKIKYGSSILVWISLAGLVLQIIRWWRESKFNQSVASVIRRTRREI